MIIKFRIYSGELIHGNCFLCSDFLLYGSLDVSPYVGCQRPLQHLVATSLSLIDEQMNEMINNNWKSHYLHCVLRFLHSVFIFCRLTHDGYVQSPAFIPVFHHDCQCSSSFLAREKIDWRIRYQPGSWGSLNICPLVHKTTSQSPLPFFSSSSVLHFFSP